ncbi:MAG: ABC transporter permease [Halobacteriota archaeon]
MFDQQLTRERGSSMAFGLPAVSVAIALLVVSPLFWIVLRASQVDPVRALSLVASAQTATILGNSVALMALVTVFSVVIGVPMAVLTTRTDLPYRRFWTVAGSLPLVVPSYIGAFAFVAAFGRHGEFGRLFGIPLPQIDGFSGAVLIITLYTYPYVFLSARAALLSMDASLISAARTLNRTPLQAFREVTVPQITPAVGAGALLVALYAISDFGTPAFMGVEVFTSAIYWEYGAFNVEYAALLSLQLLAVTAVVLLIEARIGQDDGGPGGSGGETIRLGRWRWPAAGTMALVAVVTLLVPVVIFARWALRGAGTEMPSLAFDLEYAVNSVYLSALAALVAAGFALPVGYLSARSDGVVGRLAERATYVGFAVPGIVIGLALVFLGSQYVPWIYRTVPLLVFAYVVRFLPQVVGSTRSAVLQVDDRLLEAARTLDEDSMGAFRRVTLPLIAPGVVAGTMLVFLTSMKELPATLMLQPIGMETLATIIWSAHSTLYYRYAALPALILVVVSGLSMLIVLTQEDTYDS